MVVICPDVTYNPREVRLSLYLESNPHSCLPVRGLSVITAAPPPEAATSGFTYSRN